MSNKFRKSSGTTLIEILVVIVVFSIGILAIAQIFPRGFQILALNRAAAMATFMARHEMENLYAHPETLPDGIVPLVADTGNPDPNFVATNNGFEGVGISSAGIATLPDGNSVDALGNPLNWEAVTGFNNVRGIIGENQSIPAPKLVASSTDSNPNLYYGGLVILQFGPTTMPSNGNGGSGSLNVYGNDFTRNLGLPPTDATVEDFQFYFNYTPYTNPAVMQLLLPTAAFPRYFQVSFSGYAYPMGQTTGNPVKRTYFAPPVLVAATGTGLQPSLVPLSLSNPLIIGTDTLTSIDYQSIRVEPIFNQLAITTAWTGNPFEVKILNPTLGTFLFSPYSYNYLITRPTGPREALKAKFNYAVKDWRILREDFRIDGNSPSTHQLPIQSLRTASQPNVDGTPSTGGTNGFGFETLPSDANGVDHFVLIDMLTGGTFMETDKNTLQNLITVDKSRGIIAFNNPTQNQTSTLEGELLLPDGNITFVNMADRPVRALYQARYEWAVQVLKAASSYSVSALTPGVGQYYVGDSSPILGGLPTRIYFPPCDTGRKVVIGQLWYEEGTDTQPRSLTSQDFEIHPAGAGGDTTKLPYIDIRDADTAAVTLDSGPPPGAGPGQPTNSYGYSARDVKGSSLVVRVVWNPNSFSLTNSSSGTLTAAQVNVEKEAAWAQSWRTSSTETFLDQGVTSR